MKNVVPVRLSHQVSAEETVPRGIKACQERDCSAYPTRSRSRAILIVPSVKRLTVCLQTGCLILINNSLLCCTPSGIWLPWIVLCTSTTQQRSHIELTGELLCKKIIQFNRWHENRKDLARDQFRGPQLNKYKERKVNEVTSVYLIILCFTTTTGLGEKVTGNKTTLPHPGLGRKALS